MTSHAIKRIRVGPFRMTRVIDDPFGTRRSGQGVSVARDRLTGLCWFPQTARPQRRGLEGILENRMWSVSFCPASQSYSRNRHGCPTWVLQRGGGGFALTPHCAQVHVHRRPRIRALRAGACLGPGKSDALERGPVTLGCTVAVNIRNKQVARLVFQKKGPPPPTRVVLQKVPLSLETKRFVLPPGHRRGSLTGRPASRPVPCRPVSHSESRVIP